MTKVNNNSATDPVFVQVSSDELNELVSENCKLRNENYNQSWVLVVLKFALGGTGFGLLAHSTNLLAYFWFGMTLFWLGSCIIDLVTVLKKRKRDNPSQIEGT